MDKQKDIQAILDLLSDYTSKYNIDDKKYKDAYNTLLSLTVTQTPATTVTPAKTKTKKANGQKTDFLDMWLDFYKQNKTNKSL